MIKVLGEFCGILSSFCFITCSIPQGYSCIKTGNGKGINPLFMLTWILGELALLIYAISLNWNQILFWNAIGNIVFISVILRYIYFPREE